MIIFTRNNRTGSIIWWVVSRGRFLPFTALYGLLTAKRQIENMKHWSSSLFILWLWSHKKRKNFASKNSVWKEERKKRSFFDAGVKIWSSSAEELLASKLLRLFQKHGKTTVFSWPAFFKLTWLWLWLRVGSGTLTLTLTLTWAKSESGQSQVSLTVKLTFKLTLIFSLKINYLIKFIKFRCVLNFKYVY